MGLRGPHLPASRGATDKLGDTTRAENWRNPEGANSLGASLGVALSHSPLTGMLLRPSTDMCPKELARDMRGFFNGLLAWTSFEEKIPGTPAGVPIAPKVYLCRTV